MKTLDEVITAHEFCVNASITGAICKECPAFVEPDCGVREDALHYLKEYREIEDEYYELKDWWAEEYVINDPLDWEELKQMVGRPIWIQENDHGYWIIIDNFFITSYGYHWLNSAEGCLAKEDMGISWQAYRKERE